ncbi:unnamed protein product [Prorocentrum cordatum]|uniref:Uncharacterized protein n=1 Tax=Prorocentrum cordatum TaxID=2364126 RepID=A0ABN9XQY4_9DINO|nr:unnamed protein product [Polarella glacialis]
MRRAGSELEALAGGLAAVALLSGCCLRRYAERGVNRLAFLASVLGATLGLSVIAVVPYDVWASLAIAESQRTGSTSELPAKESIGHCWAAIYWATTLLCYVVCPVLMEFEASGDFTVRAKLRTSLRRNAVYYVCQTVVGAVVLVWLILTGEVQGSLEGFCIAASNAWGLLLLTVLMGYGLVAVPRHMIQLADPAGQLRKLYAQTAARDEARLSCLFELQDLIQQVRAALAMRDQTEPCAEELELPEPARSAAQAALGTLHRSLSKCERLYQDLNSSSAPVAAPGRAATSLPASPARAVSSAELEEGGAEEPLAGGRGAGGGGALLERRLRNAAGGLERLAELHRSLKAAGLEARRAACTWESHVHRCMFFEDLEGSQFKAAAELMGCAPRPGLAQGCCSRTCLRLGQCWLSAVALWLRAFRARALRAAGWLCGAISAVIVVGQLTIFRRGWSLSLLSLLFRQDCGPWWTQAFCIVPLGYMTYTVYFSIFSFRIGGWFGLYTNHSTDTGSLLWCASILARLSAPLCYHFLLLIRVEGTTFQDFMGAMNVVPVLGESVNSYFPLLVAVLCCLNLLNVYARIMQCLSFGTVELDLAAGGDREHPLSEGRQLIERERRRRAEECAMELKDRSEPGPLAAPLAAPAG